MSGRLLGTELGMRPEVWFVFSRVARHLRLWVLVRWTNSKSIQWIGNKHPRYRYIPKPIDCKPKTADRDSGSKKVAGLVIDPTVHPDAFEKASKQEGAPKEWKKFLAEQGVQDSADLTILNPKRSTVPLRKIHELGAVRHILDTRGVSDHRILANIPKLAPSSDGHRVYDVDRDPGSDHYGCLRLNGAYLFGDYDLKDLISENDPRCNTAFKGELFGQRHMVNPHYEPFRTLVNDAIDIPMIQHAPSAQFTDHDPEDKIEAFGPGGQASTLLDLEQVELWYRHVFAGRTPVAPKFDPASRISSPSQSYEPRSTEGLHLPNSLIVGH